ncbi:MAG TPA: VCBS repeat-containing protein [Anaeromyxobacteraceae bacterium]|nr:VCBS repeat-containing protein [Anaeromyxobacteraceae bacterium]
MTPLLAALALLAAPEAASGALGRAGEAVASRLAELARPGELLALAVSAPGAEALAAPLGTAVSEALSRRGFAVAPLGGGRLAEPEAAARAMGADRLLRLQAALSAGRRELSLLAEVIPTRQSFFLQRLPEVRPGPSRLLSLTLPADAAVLALARGAPPRGRGPLPVAVRLLARFEEPVLALAAGDPGGGPSLLLVTPSALVLLGRDGRELLRRPHPAAPLSPLRRPAAAAAVGDFGAGRVAVRLAGAPSGEVLAFVGGALRAVASLAPAPLWASDSGRVFGAFVPGKPTLADQFTRLADAAARPRSAREFAAFAGAPRAGAVAFAAVTGEGVALLLGPDLAPVGRLEGVGAGLALADLDGDGEPELVASDAAAGIEDRVRVLRLPSGQAVHESASLPGSILAGAAADLTGDGRDDAVLCASLPDGTSELWLVTADRREMGP